MMEKLVIDSGMGNDQPIFVLVHGTYGNYRLASNADPALQLGMLLKSVAQLGIEHGHSKEELADLLFMLSGELESGG